MAARAVHYEAGIGRYVKMSSLPIQQETSHRNQQYSHQYAGVPFRQVLPS